MVFPSPVFTFKLFYKKYKKKSPRICTWKDLKNEKKDNTGTYYPYRSRTARLPWIANYLNEHAAKSTISTYENEVKHTDKKEREEMLEKAREYNEILASSHVVLTDPFSGETNGGISEKEYYQLLNLDNTGVMCSLEIPSIDVDLPVYHGTSNSVLEKGVGHLEGTSLPVGGKDTHAVFTGHTGLNKAKLFTDLTELQKGDQFYIRVLDKILAYEVCRIDVVLPEDTSKLSVVDGQDLVTLVTCTPYGQNTIAS